MSSPSETSGAHGKGIMDYMKSAGELFQPQGERNKPSIVGAVGEMVKSTWDACRKTLGVLASAPVAAVELPLLAVNNTVGLGVKGVDKFIAQPIDWCRHAMYRLFTDTSALLSGGGEHHAAALAGAH